MQIEIATKNTFDDIISKSEFVLIYFFSPLDSNYLNTISKLIEINKILGKKIKVIRVNASVERRISTRYQVFISPEILLLKNQSEVGRFKDNIQKENIISLIS